MKPQRGKDTRRYYVTRGQEVYGPLEKEQIRQYLDEGFFKPEHGIFCLGWPTQQYLEECFPEWFKGLKSREGTQADKSAGGREGETQGLSSRDRAYLLMRGLVGDSDIDRMPREPALALVRLHRHARKLERWLFAGGLGLVALLVVICLLVFHLLKDDPFVHESRPETVPSLKGELPVPPQAQQAPPASSVSVAPPKAPAGSVADVREAVRMAPVTPAQEPQAPIVVGQVDVGEWDRFPVASITAFLVPEVGEAMQQDMERGLTLFTALAQGRDSTEMARYAKALMELRQRRPNWRPVREYGEAAVTLVRQYDAVFDVMQVENVVAHTTGMIADLERDLEATPLSAEARQWLRANLLTYVQEWAALAAQVEAFMERTDFRSQWQGFAQERLPVLDEALRRAAVDQVAVEANGGFALKGAGTVILRLTFGPYVIHVPQGHSGVPVRVTLNSRK